MTPFAPGAFTSTTGIPGWPHAYVPGYVRGNAMGLINIYGYSGRHIRCWDCSTRQSDGSYTKEIPLIGLYEHAETECTTAGGGIEFITISTKTIGWKPNGCPVLGEQFCMILDSYVRPHATWPRLRSSDHLYVGEAPAFNYCDWSGCKGNPDPSPTPSVTPSITVSPSTGAPPVVSKSPTPTPTRTPRPQPSVSPSPTPSLSISVTPTITVSPTASPTASPAAGVTPTPSASSVAPCCHSLYWTYKGQRPDCRWNGSRLPSHPLQGKKTDPASYQPSPNGLAVGQYVGVYRIPEVGIAYWQLVSILASQLGIWVNQKGYDHNCWCFTFEDVRGSYANNTRAYQVYAIYNGRAGCTPPGVSPTPSPTPSITPSITLTPTVTPTSSPYPGSSRTPTPTPTLTPAVNVTPTPSISVSVTPSKSVTPTATPPAGVTPTPSPSMTAAASPTPAVSPSISQSPTPTPTPTVTPTKTPPPTPPHSPTATPTKSVTPTVTRTATPTPTSTPTPGVTVTPTPSITVTPTPAASPTLNAPPGPPRRVGIGTTLDCHVALSSSQGTPGGVTGGANWFATHLRYFFDDNVSKAEINMLYYKIDEDEYAVSYNQKSVFANNCPSFASGGNLNEFLMIDEAKTKVNGSGMRTEKAGVPDSGSLFRNAEGGIRSSMAGVFGTTGGPFELIAARGLGDGLDITLFFELVQLDGRADRNEILQAFVDMKQDRYSSYNFANYVGHINGVLVAWLPVIAKASKVGGFFWHCISKVADPNYFKGYRETGPGVDGIGNFTGIPRANFEGSDYQEVALSPAEITKVVVRAGEKKLPEPIEYEVFPVDSDECFDPSVAKPAAVMLYHDCGRNDSDPGTWIRGAVKAKLYIDGKYDTDEEYTYKHRDFSEEFQQSSDEPITEFWFRNDPNSDHGLSDDFIGDNLEDGDYSEVSIIPTFGDIKGVGGLACGYSFINHARIIYKEALGRAIIDEKPFGRPNGEYDKPTFMYGLDIEYKLTAVGEGEVCFPKDISVPVQCCRGFNYTITKNFKPNESLHRAFFCPDKANLSIAHINATITETAKIPNDQMPDSFKYKYEFLQDTEFEINNASVQIYAEADIDGNEMLIYTLDPTEQKRLDYNIRYIVDTCDHPVGKIVAEVEIGNNVLSYQVEYKSYYENLRPRDILAPSLSGPNAEESRELISIICSAFNRGFFGVTAAEHLAGTPAYRKIDTGYSCDNFLNEDGDFPEKQVLDPYSGDDEATADSYDNYETDIRLDINGGHEFSWTNYHRKDYSHVNDPNGECHCVGENLSETKFIINNIYIPFVFDDADGNDVQSQRMPDGDEVLVQWTTEQGTFIDWADRVPEEGNFSYSPRVRFNAGQEVKFDLKIKKMEINSYEGDTTVISNSNQTDLPLYTTAPHTAPDALETYDVREDGVTKSWVTRDKLREGEYAKFITINMDI